jgi:alpha-L-arabinofuranosidase
VERYRIFSNAIREKYPDIRLVSSVGPFSGGEQFEFLDREMRGLKTDFLDEHYYMPPDFFLKNATRYDRYDRNGPKIFAGEYAAHIRGTEGAGRNTWLAAVSEAAFMTGLERNADVVYMCSYAPLFSHADAWQWAPDLIWFDNLSSYGTPSYYVQKLFSVNKGTHTVPALINNQVVAGQDSLYVSAVTDSTSNELIIKIVNAAPARKVVVLKLEGIKTSRFPLSVVSLAAPTLEARNSHESPRLVFPEEKVTNQTGRSPSLTVLPYSLQIIKIPLNQNAARR